MQQIRRFEQSQCGRTLSIGHLHGFKRFWFQRFADLIVLQLLQLQQHTAEIGFEDIFTDMQLDGGLGDVTGVHFGRDFVSVSAGPGTDWAMLQADVASILLDHFVADMPLFHPASASGISVAAGDGDADELPIDPADADIVDQIKDLIETRIRPAVANDGGDIRFRGFDRGNVYLVMQGACAGCPSSTATLKQGIESLLKHYVPEVIAVHAV